MNRKFEELVKLVEDWAAKKNILKDTLEQKKAQYLKSIEERQELIKAIKEDDAIELVDALGDELVTIIILAKQHQFKLNHSKNLDFAKLFCHSNNINDVLIDYIFSIDKLAELYLKNQPVHQDIFDDACECLFKICFALNYHPEVALNYAYNEISNRKGKTINNTFIKEK